MNKLDDSLRLQALDLARTGHSHRQICRQLGVSKSSVTRWLRAAPVDTAPSPARTSPLEHAPAVQSGAGAREMLTSVVANAAEIVDRALAGKDMAAAQRSVVDLREGAGALQRLEQTLDVGGIRMTMAEIHEAMTSIHRNARELIESGPRLLCEGCHVGLTTHIPDPPSAPEAQAKSAKAADESPAAPRAREAFELSAVVAKRAAEDDNLRAAQRANRQALGAARVVSRIERDERARDGVQTYLIPQVEIDAGHEDIRERTAALAKVPLMCPACLRASRVAAVTASRAN